MIKGVTGVIYGIYIEVVWGLGFSKIRGTFKGLEHFTEV